LIEGLTAEVVMADTAYDADHLRQAIAARGALAVIPNNPSRALKHPLDKHLYGTHPASTPGRRDGLPRSA
jgi:transposase